MQMVMRFVMVAVGFGIVLITMPMAVFGIDLAKGEFWDNPRYAAKFFDGLVPFERVLASRRWNTPGTARWDCTFAVVDLAPDTPALPGGRRGDVSGGQFQWGDRGAASGWLPTPAAALPRLSRDAVATCADRLPPAAAGRIRAALDAPGAFYWRDRTGATVQLYAPGKRMAAHLRYGD